MAIDYAQLAQTAQALIDANGRDVTFVRFGQTAADPAKPWEGPADPVGSPDASDTQRAVFVPPSGAAQLGLTTLDTDLLKRTSEIAIVGGVAGFDLATANAIVDDGVRKKVSFTETLRPNTVTLLYFIGVER